MADDNFLEHFHQLVAGADEDATSILTLLISETVAYRDRLKKETGRVLTVEDTTRALEALDAHMRSKKAPELNDMQQRLFSLWVKALESSRPKKEGDG